MLLVYWVRFNYSTDEVWRISHQTHLPLTGMCPQLSLQVMMGVGTPTAWQVNVTVDPRAAWTDSSGGLVTEGGPVMCQENEWQCLSHIINEHVEEGWHVTGICRSSESHKCPKVRGNIICCYGRTIPFQFSGMDSSQKAQCLSQHMCEKSLVHSKLVTVYKGTQRVTIETSQRSRERRVQKKV